MKYLIIVESPAKAHKIENFLKNFNGNSYIVKSSFGHIRDLEKKKLGVDVDNNFKPTYKITNNKIVKELKRYKSLVDKVIIASDEDREGEAIGWHLCKVLGLDVKSTERITFNEITKKAIQSAVIKPRILDMNMVNAQQARRILDRLVGFSLSPLLWKSIGPSLSAGRVQSIVLKLVVEKEDIINKFKESKVDAYYYISGLFDKKLKGELNSLENSDNVEFLKDCKVSTYNIQNIQLKINKKNPPPPYTTSSLQQDACSKLNIGSKMIMSLAQKLYEGGHITYHRTDSTMLSEYIQLELKTFIEEEYSDKYYQFRQYKKKVKNSQEAHEAIRPTKITQNVEDSHQKNMIGDDLQYKLYKLIWKRTVASQMSSAEYYSQSYKITISKRKEFFTGKQDLLKFEGYLKIYGQTPVDIENNRINNNNNDEIEYNKITCDQKYKQPPGRYSEGSLIKNLEKLGIGRPSTYASVINTIISRKYTEIRTIKGEKKEVINYKLEKDKITKKKTTFSFNSEKKKMIPTQIGIDVCKYLLTNFKELMDYTFTSTMEDKLDNISNGKDKWTDVVGTYYNPMNTIIKGILKNLKNNFNLELLSTDDYKVIKGKYGPMLICGNKRIGIPKSIDAENIDEKIAKELLSYPKLLGQHKEKDIIVNMGGNGRYIKYNNKGEDIVMNLEKMGDVTLETIVKKIEERTKNVIMVIGKDLKVMNGKYGPYIIYKKKIYKIPSDYIEKIDSLTKNELMKIVKNTPKKKYIKKDIKK
jgi:DNA topoisomerase-1